MTKIESARIIVNKKGVCIGILCADCFTTREKCGCKELGRLNWDKRKLQLAEAYIKRHEQKCKKRIIPKYTADVQPDTTGSELKKIVMKPANTYPTPLEIAKIIRDNEYVCLYVWDCTRQCPISNSKTGQLDCSINRKQLIDSYIAEHDHIEDNVKKVVCVDGIGGVLTVGKEYTAEPSAKYDDMYLVKIDSGEKHEYYKTRFVSIEEYANRTTQNEKPEPVIEPIKFDDPVPEYVYWTEDSRIERVASASFLATKERDNINAFVKDVIGRTYNLENCYKTLDEAVAVAKKNWGKK